MSASAIPTTPTPLTGEQVEAMAQRQIKKHHVAIVLLHWFNAISWLLELSTGAGLIVSPYYRFAPIWYLQMMEGIFGSRANMLRFHIAVGLTWTTVFLVYAIFGFRNYLRIEVLQNEIGLDRDDLLWLKVRTLLLLGRTKDPLPPQGVYNAGQKLFALLVYTMVPLIMLTGLTMTFHWFGTAFVGWAMVLHFFAVGMVVSGLMIHVYMGAVFPEEKPAFYSMITGVVDELYAYRHHFKWWRAVKVQEQAWRDEMRSKEEGEARSVGEKEGDDSLQDKAPLISQPQSGDRR
jgi:formate dehydrogenase subunit gamma